MIPQNITKMSKLAWGYGCWTSLINTFSGYRRVNLKTFPYYIAYIVREDTLWILAIAHSHSKPEYWILRKNEIS